MVSLRLHSHRRKGGNLNTACVLKQKSRLELWHNVRILAKCSWRSRPSGSLSRIPYMHADLDLVGQYPELHTCTCMLTLTHMHCKRFKTAA